MYVFSRGVTLSGDPRDGMAFANEICALVNRKTELNLSLWTVVAGAPVGTVYFNALMPSQVELDTESAKLRQDDEYLSLFTKGTALMVAPPEDTVVRILHNAGPEYGRANINAIAEVTDAVIAPGQYTSALQWSVEVADLGSSITGVSGLFGMAVAGPFGHVGWISTVPDMAAYESMNEQLNKEPHYMTKLDAIGGLFVPDSGRRIITRRIA